MHRARSAFWRRTAAMGAVLLVSGVFTIRLLDLQVVNAAEHVAESKGKRAVPVVIPALRGDIVDRNGNILATTDERYDVQLSPKNTKLYNGVVKRINSESGEYEEVPLKQILQEIGDITGQTVDELQSIIDTALEADPESDFAYVKRSVDLTALNKLKALNVPWLTFASVFNRTYPNGAVGGNLIGFVSSDNEAQAGIELSQNECLVGTDGSEVYERSADSIRLPGSTVITKEAVNGGTVELTIDRDLQWQVQQVINDAATRFKTEWSLGVVMDAKTGELLAVAEDGSVDPNNVSASDPSKRDARAFINPYEPGSTAKMITAAALIEEGKANAATQNLTPDYWEPEPNVRFGDSFNHGPERWTLAGIIARSSNVGTTMLGNRLDKQTRYEYMRKFGFGESTQAGLPLEDAGLLYPPEQWDPQTSYNVMFGQGFSTTIVQTASAYQAIANGGVRIPPSLVKSCTNAAGETTVLEHGEPVRVVSEATAKEMTDILETVSSQDWMQWYMDIPGYRIAGKTGTGEQSDGQGGYRSDYVSTFAAFFPKEDPQYVVVTSIAFPKVPDPAASSLETWKSVAERVIREYHLPPTPGEYEPLPMEY